MHIELINNQDGVKLDLQGLGNICSYISGKFDTSDKQSLNIVFISDEKIRDLNKKYRNVDRSTDVLSFSYLEASIENKGKESPAVIGEVYIAPLTALKNSREQEGDWNFQLEIILLIIHGILHIYGYDHEQENEKAAMDNIQDSLIHDIRNKDWNRY